MILAGDIGGTKTVLALYEPTADGLGLVREASFPSQGPATFEAIIDAFFVGAPRPAIRSACFGVAGPVIDGVCRTTNLPWVLVATDLAAYLGAERVALLNDLEAAAFGMLHLKPGELEVLNPGIDPPRKGNAAVIAAGTGLGEAFLYWDGEHHHPVSSEGGHCDFAPQNPLEDELLLYLRKLCGGHVSYERVLSGPGFHHLYTFFIARGEHPESPEVAEACATGDPNVAITRFGLAGTDPNSVAALDLFASIYGAEAGNLALKCMARSVFVGGGIAPKVLPVLLKGGFLKSFLSKGRFDSLMQDIRVSVALNPRAPLIGAAHYARRL
jgi:glucokinase